MAITFKGDTGLPTIEQMAEREENERMTEEAMEKVESGIGEVLAAAKAKEPKPFDPQETYRIREDDKLPEWQHASVPTSTSKVDLFRKECTDRVDLLTDQLTQKEEEREHIMQQISDLNQLIKANEAAVASLVQRDATVMGS